MTMTISAIYASTFSLMKLHLMAVASPDSCKGLQEDNETVTLP